MVKGPKFLVLSGDGINCERETAAAVIRAGALADIIHINDFLGRKGMLTSYEGLCFPGGFSFGDELGSGQIMGLKLRTHLGGELEAFVAAGKLIIGICNGFQILMKLKLLPGAATGVEAALAPNEDGLFLDRWADLSVVRPSKCLWTSKLQKDSGPSLSLPIRHGEGRVVFAKGEEEQSFARLLEAGQIPLLYRENVNGSYGRIAGLCDPTGRVFGLMPHPEADQGLGWGRLIFESAVEYLAGSKAK